MPLQKVVKEKYEKTQKPVHINVIIAELGKYRQFVKPSSLVFATRYNSRLEQISKDFFVPKEAQDVDTPSDLDRIFREFQEDRARNS